MTSPNGSHHFPTTAQPTNEGQQRRLPPLQLGYNSSISATMGNYFIQPHNSNNVNLMHRLSHNFNLESSNTQHPHAGNSQHAQRRHSSYIGETTSQMSYYPERTAIPISVSETQVVSLTVATDRLALSTRSEPSSLASPPFRFGDSRSPNMESNTRRTPDLLTHSDPTSGFKAKRRAEGSSEEDNHPTAEDQSTEDGQASTSHKKLANKRSKGKLSMIYTAPTTASVDGNSVNLSYASSSTPQSISPPVSRSIQSFSPNFHGLPLGFQSNSVEMSHHPPLYAAMMEGMEHSRLQNFSTHFPLEQNHLQSQHQTHLGQSQYPYFPQTSHGYLSQSSQLPGMQRRYSYAMGTRYSDGMSLGEARPRTQFSQGAEATVDSRPFYQTLEASHFVNQRDVYQHSLQYVPCQGQAPQSYSTHILTSRSQQYSHQMFQRPQSLNLTLTPTPQQQESRDWDREFRIEATDELETLSDDESSTTHPYLQPPVQTASGPSYGRSRQRSRTLPTQDLFNSLLSPQQDSTQPSLERSSLTPTASSAQPILEKIPNQLPLDFSWLLNGGSENTLPIPQINSSAVNRAGAPQQIRQVDGNAEADITSASSPPRHECQICLKVFTRPFNLRSHLLAHENKKPFDCMSHLPIGGCHARFTRRHDLLRHIRAKHPNATLAERTE
ncbi:hypothetical protein BGZ79_006450 [Entomortierella chlamydospora]|nr:hypothetical protein BGZ79_006450 [Entomortierella chlamydospora]